MPEHLSTDLESLGRHDPRLCTEVERAVAAGLRFLEGIQRADGSLPTATWSEVGGQEMNVVPEQSVFPTLFIGSVLRAVAGADAVVEGATQFAARNREPDWVWRYLPIEHPRAGRLMPDVDDTALGALLLREAGHVVDAADEVLLSNRDAEGRFYTWITVRGAWWRSRARVRIVLRQLPHLDDLIAGFRNDAPRVRDMDAGVNANVVLHLGRRPGTERAIDYLLQVARSGEVDDRWYQDPLTLWYLISRALNRHGIAAAITFRQRLAECDPSTPLQLAAAICVALDWGAPVPDEWIAEVLASQSPNGEWERLTIYAYTEENLRWGGEAITTAMCVEALARWLGSIDSRRR